MPRVRPSGPFTSPGAATLPAGSPWPFDRARVTVVAEIVYVGPPLGKGRPRLGAGGVYTPRKTAAYEASLKALFCEAVGFGKADRESLFGIRCHFYRPNAVRIDLDNMLKAVCDAANGVVWGDDSQLVEEYSRKWLRCPAPRAEVLIYRVTE